ncbi:putative presequence translocase-associated motor subunit protein [Phaeoacremonium minimum UCRPA7]|uniref:Presequence translocated-associated motor subunit PAM17 n=1 Tax=Phaeoacremonium minimum (strain UCR-PA7) TaxID=1286976 RepID=R8BKS9_PHAM7|nr:putative presequence translocase-associated motor subunit protein [Phaeoacremonium minimum UCRPA7]EON99930.1 putative presequence translocase-associated motor subunit protein [Phaeoacremonium minimum UCRPA7]
MLRSGVARNGAGIQPILLRSTACPYSTFTSSPFAIRPKLADSPITSTSRSSITGRKSVSAPLVIRQTGRRNASTVSSNEQDATAAAAAAAKQQAAHADEPPLDWNTFFALRKSRRRWQLTFSIASSAAGGTGGALFLSTGSADWAVNQIPLDPFVTLGLMTFGFAALGWLVGPVLGSQIFYLLNRKYKSQMALKESQFFARIKKHRVDPSSSSAGNPVPDFYGEKISSVAGYRQWLKDQRAFNKKRTTFV